MAEQMKDEIKGIYEKKRSDLKENVESLRKEINAKIDLKKNESYKEVESK